MIQLFIILIALIAAGKAHFALACATGAPAAINLFSSYETGAVGATTPLNEFNVHSCSPADVGKFLMITMGPDLIGLDYSRQISFTEDFRDDECTLKNSPLRRLRDYAEELKDYQAQRLVFEKCVEMEITDLSLDGLNLPTQPIVNGKPLCSLNIVDTHTAKGWGGACFVGLRHDSNLTVKYKPRPECADPSYLKQLGISPQDVMGAFSIYLTDNASGLSTDLESLHSGDFRMTLAPASSLLRLSTNFGTSLPRWPVDYAPDLHLGELTIVDQGPASGVVMSWLTDNECKESCSEGMCSSPCNYLTPVAAEVSLSEQNGTEGGIYVSSWYQGGAVPAGWQGMVRAPLHRIEYNPFSIGKKFRIHAKFSYPDTYFRLAGESVRKNMIALINLKNSIVGRDPLPALTPLSALRKILPNIPDLDPLPNLERPNMGDKTFDMRRPIDTLTSYLSLENWPPYYERLCDSELMSCLSPYSEKAFLELDVDFEIAGIAEDHTFILSDYVVRRRSSFGGGYERRVEELPSISCRQIVP